MQGFDAGNVAISPALIVVDSAGGQIKGAQAGILKKDEPYTVSYKYYPIVNSTATTGQDNNPVFDGLRPFVRDEVLQLDSTRSSFQGTKPSGVVAVLDKASVGVLRVAPIDVKITFTKSLGDTTATGAYTAPADSIKDTGQKLYVKVPFKIENATDQTPLNILIKDAGVKGRWDVGDEIIILTPPPYNLVSTNTMMGILIKPSSSAPGASAPIIPAGTIYLAKTKKPFSAKDAYTVTTKAVSFDAQLAKAKMDNIFAVPNPYVMSSQFELPGNRPDLRGDRVIQFRNLPTECTIRIYTITGELVQTLRKNNTAGYLNWDVLTSESQRLAYGVYIYHVEEPTGGTKIGRLAIIK